MTDPAVTRALGLGGEEHAGSHQIRTKLGPRKVPPGPGLYLSDILSTDEADHTGTSFEHGLSGYQWHGCHCSVCRAANAARVRKTRARHRAERRHANNGTTEGEVKK